MSNLKHWGFVPVMTDRALKQELQTKYDETRFFLSMVKQYKERYPTVNTVDGLMKLIKHNMNDVGLKKHHDELEKDFGKMFGHKI